MDSRQAVYRNADRQEVCMGSTVSNPAQNRGGEPMRNLRVQRHELLETGKSTSCTKNENRFHNTLLKI